MNTRTQLKHTPIKGGLVTQFIDSKGNVLFTYPMKGVEIHSKEFFSQLTIAKERYMEAIGLEVKDYPKYSISEATEKFLKAGEEAMITEAENR